MSKQKIDVSEYLNSPTLEAFSALNANIGLNKKILKVILVLSFNPGDGKTTVAMNLAISGAKSGTRVLYVDADLRKPRRLKRHGAESIKGLSDFSEETKLAEIICQTDVENLHYITAGMRLVDPVEFLSSKIFDEFITVSSQQYEMVVIDSSSLGQCVDSAIIAAKVSGVLVVTRAQKTRYQTIDRIQWQMKNVGANIIGIVMNKVEKRDFRSYYVLQNNAMGLTEKFKLKLKFKRFTRNS